MSNQSWFEKIVYMVIGMAFFVVCLAAHVSKG